MPVGLKAFGLSLLEDYQASHFLGSGGFGQVYAANKWGESEEIAIKVATDYDNRASLLNEYVILDRLAKVARCKYIIQRKEFIDTGTEAGEFPVPRVVAETHKIPSTSTRAR